MDCCTFSLVLVFFFFLIYIPTSTSVPFVLLHGVGQTCADKKVSYFTNQLSNWSATQGYCLESSYSRFNSWFLTLESQASIVCSRVKEMNELKQGFHMIGLSQGAIIARAVLEFCDGAPPVKNLITLAGAHAGTASTPFCRFKVLCALSAYVLNFFIYTNFVQDHLAASGYIRIPSNELKYFSKSKFLPKLNNEIPDQRNETYKERFTGLENLVLIMCKDDKVLIPRETSWFGHFSKTIFSEVLRPQQTSLYVEDWIGLKALDEAGKVKYIGVRGDHLDISDNDMKEHIVPYLKIKKSTELVRYQESKHISKEMSTKVMVPYREPMHIPKEMSTQEVSYRKPKRITGPMNKELKLDRATTPRVVYNWRPTMLTVRRQCLKYVQVIRR
ncbi:uncharacterized protein LOC130800712 isoform X1 [Amaranthus tricolor]|uniref:uncharacterized protein LOC130800712 isoform X1 n=1 Tax=Amaranthus tricolor TaxID=29722 RepID=UPI00258A8C81|nr:uncharacterized protein LOC130800712 isoform X1 [Amaranthus tricolor]